MRNVLKISALFAVMLISACGQSGALYLPNDKAITAPSQTEDASTRDQSQVQ